MHRCKHCAGELADDGFPDWTGGRLCERCLWAQQIVAQRRRQPLAPWWIWVIVKWLVLPGILVGIARWLVLREVIGSLR